LKKKIVVLGTSARGGINSVIESHVNSPLSEHFDFIRIETHDGVFFFKKITIFFVAILKFIVKLSSLKIEVVHAHVSMNGSVGRKCVLLMLSRIFRVRYMLHIHGSEFEKSYSEGSWFYKCMVKILLGGSTDIVVLSKSMLGFTKKFSCKNTWVIPNYCIDHNQICEARCSHGNVFLFLGALIERKGIYDLLDAIQLVKKQQVEIMVKFAGDGDIPGLLLLCERLGIDEHVEFTGWVEGKQKYELLESSDFLILPSYNEGLPVSIIDALSFALPVISTNIAGIPDLVSSENGVLVAPGDVRNLSSAMIEMAMSDNSSYSELSNSSRQKYLYHFSPQPVLAKLHTAYISGSR